jgi:hypothetical protein
MVLLDAALHLVYELPYRCHYAHRRLARLGSSRSWSPQGRPCRAFIAQPRLEAFRCTRAVDPARSHDMRIVEVARLGNLATR